MNAPDAAALEARAATLAAEAAAALGAELPTVGPTLHARLVELIPELRGDQPIIDLLQDSLESNIALFVDSAVQARPVEELALPAAAVEYARRLAQCGISSNALARAYRLGQRWLLDWFTVELGRVEPDARVAYLAAARLQTWSFAYIDWVSERVVAEYEHEREQWLANQNRVRTTMLTDLLAGTVADTAAAERALGYRLRGHHLAVVVWTADTESPAQRLHRLERLVTRVAETLGATGAPFFLAQDRARGWGWLPLGPGRTGPDTAGLPRLVEAEEPAARLALGAPGAGTAGFVASHRGALRAYTVAVTAGVRAGRVTSYADPGVRAAALLTADLAATRELVAAALGPLGADDPAAAVLRETLLEFLTAQCSYVGAAGRLHVHKNTVKYRLEKATGILGRPVENDPLGLELALTACRWLGPAVLSGR
ncbi:PucR family transcriptional regulator [Mycolicibacillus trivialis]|uniref:PucR family transcriptional regulator n=1 Tax=Mycolicibacillus trivialis TaxID=1798 RepID=UPI000A159486|nr:helix-turn-helix domain-containing protein [Mycolicibacillus trivialis]